MTPLDTAIAVQSSDMYSLLRGRGGAVGDVDGDGDDASAGAGAGVGGGGGEHLPDLFEASCVSSAQEAGAVSQALTATKTVQVLDLAASDFGSDGLKHLAAALHGSWFCVYIVHALERVHIAIDLSFCLARLRQQHVCDQMPSLFRCSFSYMMLLYFLHDLTTLKENKQVGTVVEPERCCPIAW
jgi:hypothetical protein